MLEPFGYHVHEVARFDVGRGEVDGNIEPSVADQNSVQFSDDLVEYLIRDRRDQSRLLRQWNEEIRPDEAAVSPLPSHQRFGTHTDAGR